MQMQVVSKGIVLHTADVFHREMFEVFVFSSYYYSATFPENPKMSGYRGQPEHHILGAGPNPAL